MAVFPGVYGLSNMLDNILRDYSVITSGTPPPTNSLERALALLDLIEKTPGGLRSGEIVRQLNIPRSSCAWICTRLAHQGYLTRDADTGRYKLGLKPVALAHGALRDLGFRSFSEPVLYRIVSQTGLAAGIGVLEADHVLLVDRAEPPDADGRGDVYQRPRDQRDIGRELPIHSTALGKALLAWLPRQQLAAYLERLVLTRRTPRTIHSKEALLLQLRGIRRRGYAIADEEHDLGLRALSAPIFDWTGAVPAALSLNGPPSAAIWQEQRRLIALVTAAASEVSSSARIPSGGFRFAIGS